MHFYFQIYKVILEIFFKLVPTVLIAGLNLRIIIVYRRSCAKRRQMTIARNSLKDDDPRKFAEERRLILLLGLYFFLSSIDLPGLPDVEPKPKSEHR